MAGTASRPPRTWAAFAAGVALLTVSARLAAQQPAVGRFSLDRFQPTPAGDAFFSVPSGGVDGQGTVRGGAAFDYAHNLLALRSGGSGEQLGEVVSDRLVMHAGASFALWNRALLSADVPVVLVNRGQDPTDASSAAASPSGASLGDLRLGVRVELFREARRIVELGLGTHLWVPTGDPVEYSGDEGARVMPHVAISGSYRRFSYAAYAGVLIREPVQVLDVGVGTEIDAGVAAGFEVVARRLMLGVELPAATVVSASVDGRSVDPFAGGTTHAEVLGCGRLWLGPIEVGVAAGPGLTRGAGTPAVRAVLSVQYAGEALGSSAPRGAGYGATPIPIRTPTQALPVRVRPSRSAAATPSSSSAVDHHAPVR